jgi:hypothetical protein
VSFSGGFVHEFFFFFKWHLFESRFIAPQGGNETRFFSNDEEDSLFYHDHAHSSECSAILVLAFFLKENS